MPWILDKLFGVDEEEKRAQEIDAQLKALNDKQLAEGKVSQELYDEWEANRIRAGLDGQGGDADFSDDIGAAFDEGWNEGADNIRGAVGSTINTVIGTPLKLIPWQLWLAAAAYLAFRLGLFDGVLKGVLKKAK